MDRLVPDQLINDVSIVLFEDDHCLDFLSVAFFEFIRALLDNLDVCVDFLAVDLSQLLEGVLVNACVRAELCQSCLHSLRPLDLVESEQNLADVLVDVACHAVSVEVFTALLRRCVPGVVSKGLLERLF